MNEIRIVSLNVRGIRSSKRHVIFRWLKDSSYDICLLQETYCTTDFVTKFRKGWSGEIIHAVSDSPHSRGVCIMFRKELKHNIIDIHKGDDGRILAINVEINGSTYLIINVYGPNDVKQRVQFLSNVDDLITNYGINNSNIIMGGDFNCVNESIDRVSQVIDNSTDKLIKLKSRFNLIDIWRKLNPDKICHTYIDPSERNSNSRIDFFLCSKTILSGVEGSTIRCAPTPDHKAVDIQVNLSNKVRGKGYWKMNVSLLDDKNYLDDMTALILETFEEYDSYLDSVTLWEFMKLRIKEFTIHYSIAKAREKVDQTKLLESKIKYYDNLLVNGKDKNIEKARKECKIALDASYEYRAKGHQIRSRARWVESGERSTRYFLGLEKSRQSNSVIKSMKDENGNETEKDDEILHIARQFYSKLYKSDNPSDTEIKQYQESLNVADKLSDEDQIKCEGEVSYKECEAAVNNMKANKSPGLDGICIEIYKAFWPLIGQFLVTVFNQCFEMETLPESQRLSVMSLIHKKDETDKIENYRPISLTNVDYRILAFILANRLQNVIGKIIDPDQTAYIKGRYIGHNIRLINDVVDYYDEKQMKGILLNIDFKKAFDSLEWDFIFSTLATFNFGPSFIQWIRTIYKSPVACVKNNGYLSDTFQISRGIRQGCPVSALLFVLSVEMLATKIRKCQLLKGFDFGVEEKAVKITQYADDATLFLNNKEELCTALNILSTFGNLAGTQLNLAKCEALWLGRDKYRQENCNLFGIKWPKVLRCLGIYVGHDKQANEILNWDDKLEQISDIFNSWSKRDLTIYGKIQIIKTFAVSKLAHSASLLPIPKGIEEKVNRLFFTFIWNATDRIKRVKLIKPTDKGGANMIDMESWFKALKAIWAIRLAAADPARDSWAQIANIQIKRIVNPKDILLFSLDKTTNFPALKTLHPFYREVVTSYSYSNSISYDDFTRTFYDQPLWGNRFIYVNSRKQNNVLYLRNWIRRGLIRFLIYAFAMGT